MQTRTGLTRWNAVLAVRILGSDLASRMVLVRRSEAEGRQWKKDEVLSLYRFFFPTLFGYIHKFRRDGEIHRMVVESTDYHRWPLEEEEEEDDLRKQVELWASALLPSKPRYVFVGEHCRPELGCHVGSERDRDVAAVTLPSGSGSVHRPLHTRHGWCRSIIWSTEQAYSPTDGDRPPPHISRCRKSSAKLKADANGTEATLVVIVHSHVRPSPTLLLWWGKPVQRRKPGAEGRQFRYAQKDEAPDEQRRYREPRSSSSSRRPAWVHGFLSARPVGSYCSTVSVAERRRDKGERHEHLLQVNVHAVDRQAETGRSASCDRFLRCGEKTTAVCPTTEQLNLFLLVLESPVNEGDGRVKRMSLKVFGSIEERTVVAGWYRSTARRIRMSELPVGDGCVDRGSLPTFDREEK
ncbi:hypothetical protein B296_00008586 [Ensete ventricosum]|uniref:Uncharacterized protein n=1 Tax=Ensete ventricosum TaxID=4639 RepID=A0A427APD7_ENSVE|nr:hypothetical protein B296_00008586 [Ensete ventricosum]